MSRLCFIMAVRMTYKVFLYDIAAILKIWHCFLVRNPLELSAMEANRWFVVRLNLRGCDELRQGYRLTAVPLKQHQAAKQFCQIISKHCSQRQSLMIWWVPSNLKLLTNCISFEETLLALTKCQVRANVPTVEHACCDNVLVSWTYSTP